MFSSRLAQAKRTSFREYGSLAEHYMREFEPKGLRGGRLPMSRLRAGAEIGSLVRLDCRYEALRTLRTAPVPNEAILRLAAFLPIAPRALTIMPLEQLLKLLFGMSLQETSKGGRP